MRRWATMGDTRAFILSADDELFKRRLCCRACAYGAAKQAAMRRPLFRPLKRHAPAQTHTHAGHRSQGATGLRRHAIYREREMHIADYLLFSHTIYAMPRAIRQRLFNAGNECRRRQNAMNAMYDGTRMPAQEPAMPTYAFICRYFFQEEARHS